MSGILLALAASGAAANFAVSANSVVGSDRGETAAGLVTTSQLPNVLVQGGVAPFTYTWSFVSGASDIICLANGEANPIWQAIVSDTLSAVWRLTVTDATAAVVTVNINVTLIWTQISAGGIEL